MKSLLRHSRTLLAPIALLCVVGLVAAMRPTPTALERVQARGELVVATRPSLTTVYQDPKGQTGMEYELANGFAERLGVRLRLVEMDTPAEVKYAVRRGKADLAAAGLTVTDERRQGLRFSTPYQQVDTLVMYRLGEARPKRIEDLIGKKVVVRAGSSHAEMLNQARLEHPALHFEQVENANAEQMLTLVEEGNADYTLINSNAYAIHRGLFPDLASGFTLGGDQDLAWAFSPSDDRSLYLAAQRYLTQMKAAGETQRLADRFYGHVEQFDLYAARSFIRHLDDRLPLYTQDFQTAASDADFDWRLLAAVAYQESLWDAAAISPTGVQGLMMLTANTAREMGVDDRTDPAQSIQAGAAYLRKIHNRIPDRIQEPDRTWMALAAYNVGFGHLEDARVLTERQGDDPDNWQAVKQRLPLLSQSAYAKQLRYGRAPGGQAALYVRHIRRYYDLLVWADNSERHRSTLLASAN
ncbi:membrane-bound lytic murein transglycosylase MltF [Alloalcanivorax mobilis]|uniref:membrane-bound lytic murein transglycosylase MltF n=1 Tax=Alloalcanivorax mobilis TaxID=2019569 RepID=UPI000B5B190B|nr:membrane-bound lytic murein transglycosylase MltF [Alloalcanivorax mobilis]ASK33358.1 lytic transglycosylase F [Alcanivorax sp. N3-2A]|tara:strand:+ start:33660 stop:35066 length:1407 start_codon:yes stop_codon:yes gene_type:complete